MLTSIKVKYVQSNWFERALRSTNLRMNFKFWPCWRCSSAYYRLQLLHFLQILRCIKCSMYLCLTWQFCYTRTITCFFSPMKWSHSSLGGFLHHRQRHHHHQICQAPQFATCAWHLSVWSRNLPHSFGVLWWFWVLQGGELKRSCCHNSRWGISGYPPSLFRIDSEIYEIVDM